MGKPFRPIINIYRESRANFEGKVEHECETMNGINSIHMK